MAEERGRGERASLPVGLSDALAFYDALAEPLDQTWGNGTRDEARRQVLDVHSQWAAELREHFRIEDRLLGVTDSPFDSTKVQPFENTAQAKQAAACVDSQAPIAFGRYRVKGLLGRGGMGSVYLGYDEQLDREVAIKVPHGEFFQSEAGRESFLREARTLAKLDHPRIIPIHDVGETDDGKCYVVCKLVDGQTLKDRMRDKPLSPRESSKLIADVADALHHAHKQGFVHRDIKPANILIDREGNAFVADFGLAVNESLQRELAGEVSGTPAYMTPEQTRGEVRFLDGRADIWSLGVILYELLVGRRPFGGTSIEEMFTEIAQKEPRPLRMIDETIPQPLESIVLKCLRKPVGDRYSSAHDLARDLRRWGRKRARQKTVIVVVLVSALSLMIMPSILQFRNETESISLNESHWVGSAADGDAAVTPMGIGERGSPTYVPPPANQLDDIEAQWNLSVSEEGSSNLPYPLEGTAAAVEFYEEALAMSERRVAEDPTNATLQRELAVSYQTLGDVSLRLGDTHSALDFYYQSLEIGEALAPSDPNNSQAQRDLSLAYMRLGDAYRQLGDMESAQELYQQCIEITELLATADSTNVEAQQDLSISYGKLAEVHELLGNTPVALELYLQSYDMLSRIAAADPNNHEIGRNLSVSYDRLGDINLEIGHTESARAFYQAARDIREKLATADANNVQAQRDLMVSYYKLARAATPWLDYDSAIENFTMALSILDQMIANQDVEQWQQERKSIANELRDVERQASEARSAVEEWETFINRPGARSRLSQRITLLARDGRFDEIPQSAAMLRSLDAENPDNLYSAACGFALCANSIQPADAESLTAEQRAQRQEYIDLAIACLREAVAAGYSDFDHMQQDPDLAILRDLPEFEELIPAGEPMPMSE